MYEPASPNFPYVIYENKEKDKNLKEHWKLQPSQWLDWILGGIFTNHKVGHSGKKRVVWQDSPEAGSESTAGDGRK